MSAPTEKVWFLVVFYVNKSHGRGRPRQRSKVSEAKYKGALS